MTILFHQIVFGPIKSRRLGNSLGINLMPLNGKFCSFDCIYCECGWNKDGKDDQKLPSKEEVFAEMETRFNELQKEGVQIDTITFSGNGEPTTHPEFAAIIDKTIELRDKIFPQAAISVLTNASRIGNDKVREALMKVTNPILKIDNGLEEYIRLIDNPQGNYSLADTLQNIKKFNGNFILQTMFLKGSVDGKYIDTTDPEIVSHWVKIALDLKPREIMMYTLDRQTPAQGLIKVTVEEMEKIAQPLINAGIKVQIRG
ncbi:MAG: radical SAM protein [Bacteroidales bacterium]|nr:radical SAM protein [Bacteroidales bacterium]